MWIRSEADGVKSWLSSGEMIVSSVKPKPGSLTLRCVQAGKTTGVRQAGGGPGGLWALLGVWTSRREVFFLRFLFQGNSWWHWRRGWTSEWASSSVFCSFGHPPSSVSYNSRAATISRHHLWQATPTFKHCHIVWLLYCWMTKSPEAAQCSTDWALRVAVLLGSYTVKKNVGARASLLKRLQTARCCWLQ